MQFEPNFEFKPYNFASQMINIECPHCHYALHGHEKMVFLGNDADGAWLFSGLLCPRAECNRFILYLKKGKKDILFSSDKPPTATFITSESRLIYPQTVLPSFISADMPEEIKKNYTEATKCLTMSPNASAALSRRCLQSILRKRAALEIPNFREGKLTEEIDQVIKSNTLHFNLNEMLRGIQIIGNFAAHPEESKFTGLIMDVDPDEAEFSLKVIDRLLSYYYVELPKNQKILEGINKKQQEKKPIR